MVLGVAYRSLIGYSRLLVLYMHHLVAVSAVRFQGSWVTLQMHALLRLNASVLLQIVEECR